VIAAMLASIPLLPEKLETSYVSTFRVLQTHPHCESAPCTAFTEGLTFAADGALYESMGGYLDGWLGVRQVDLATGGAVGPVLPPREGQFAEGLTALPDGRLLQLTYRENQVNEYKSAPALAYVQTTAVTLGAEGWGLARSADGAVLYATDSTDQLLHINATTLEVLDSVPIVDARLDGGAGRHIFGVNELELVGDEIWGNVFPTCAGSSGTRRNLCDHSECVARIDPASGQVRGWIDFSELVEREPKSVRDDLMNSVFNGIAFDAASGRLLVTGKNWENIYSVEIETREGGAEHVQSACRLAR